MGSKVSTSSDHSETKLSQPYLHGYGPQDSTSLTTGSQQDQRPTTIGKLMKLRKVMIIVLLFQATLLNMYLISTSTTWIVSTLAYLSCLLVGLGILSLVIPSEEENQDLFF